MPPPTTTTTLPQIPLRCRLSLHHRKQIHSLHHRKQIPHSYRWSPRTPSWDSDALTFPSLCLKLWQVLPGGWPHVYFFSIKNFSWQEFQQFVDRVFRGYHHLSIPWGRKIKKWVRLPDNREEQGNSLPLLVKIGKAKRYPLLLNTHTTATNKKVSVYNLPTSSKLEISFLCPSKGRCSTTLQPGLHSKAVCQNQGSKLGWARGIKIQGQNIVQTYFPMVTN